MAVTAQDILEAVTATPRKRLPFRELEKKFPDCSRDELCQLVATLKGEGKVTTFSDSKTAN